MIFCTQESDLQIKSKITFLYFYAVWMPFHKNILSMIYKLKKDNITFFAIDVDYFKGLCKRFDVTSIPEIIILLNGEEIKRINGTVLSSNFNGAFSDIYNLSSIINGDNI